jgi:hypothetical protein
VYRSFVRAVGPVPSPNKIGKNHRIFWIAYISIQKFIWSDLSIRCPRSIKNKGKMVMGRVSHYPKGNVACDLVIFGVEPR